jgi:RNA polymerase sigma-70 factor (ECF subfamily)
MGDAELSDEALLAEARRSAGAARDSLVDELFARHYERVARWCLRLTGNRESAADLAQEVFLKAHRHLDSFKGTARFSTWLYSIARNESMNRVRRLAPPADSDEVLADLATIEAGPEELAGRNERGRRVRTFLSSTLDQVERLVFVLHYAEDMPLEAITRLLRLSNSSGAKAYIVSARRKLAKATQRLRARGEQL